MQWDIQGCLSGTRLKNSLIFKGIKVVGFKHMSSTIISWNGPVTLFTAHVLTKPWEMFCNWKNLLCLNSFHAWTFFMPFVVYWYFSKSFFSKNSFRNTFIVSNSLGPDQARQNVGLDLGPNCLSADDTSGQRVNRLIQIVPLLLSGNLPFYLLPRSQINRLYRKLTVLH